MYTPRNEPMTMARILYHCIVGLTGSVDSLFGLADGGQNTATLSPLTFQD